METKANFVLIGAVTILGMLGVLGLLVWFAKVEVDRQYAEYEILFDSVSGLGMAADVRYNGLSVGKVIGLGLDADNPDKVRVRIEVAADTPVKTDTTAQLNSQGVTGVSFVALTGGSQGAALLRDTADPTTVPLITAQRSAVQALTEDAPDLVNEAVEAIKEVRNFLGPENQAAVSNLLQNLDRASGQLDKALSDFSDISQTVSEGTAEISKFTGRLDEIGETVQTSLLKINETLDAAKLALGEIEPTMRSATAAFTTAESTISGVDSFVQTRVPQIADDLSSAIRSIDTATNDLKTQLDTVLTQFGGSAEAATQRFSELETTIATLDLTLADARKSLTAVESASTNFQGLIDGDTTALIVDARETLKAVQGSITGIDTVFQQDVPGIVTDIRTAVTSATGVIDQVSTDLVAFTTRLDPLVDSGDETLKAATETLQNANRTLANLDRALIATEKTLDVAERTFAGADTIISTDLSPAISDVRTAAGQFEATMATLSEDIPAITTDLRDAMARALDVVQQIEDTVSASAPPVQAFAQTGLPEFTKFAREAQQLVYQLEQLTKKMQRDPARFFFGNNIPEFRR
ncbi:virulence factor Mce family protein [Thalassovita gelatinovora]|uniref:Virulence factor Mce family protein n=1 Tax=Thalassovita gelatinovora TaxID=53501 RepID=A0A0N7LV70_THAGE|nr:MlaD family protein [Thalassovita gelatinovora]QIZ80064.1 MCE family protein [Thalassovita gelatinovora]CUH65474.1 virulence factor Mce family protein [Thalassovita gelatinovora]SER09082.1 phospholipid/cholesterol/gamma-HCH transport system substrate-binding protein [Thalassovita gelatinovora]